MSEAEIVELGEEVAARLGTSLHSASGIAREWDGSRWVPEREFYDGEKFDATMDLLNNEPAFFHVYDCDSQAEAFLAHSGEFGSGILREARQLASAWQARSTSP